MIGRIALAWFMLSGVALAFDSTDYRQATYGAPDHYCDLTLSVAAPSGTGTLGDPWNGTRCMSEPVAGDVIGLLPVGAGTPVDLPSRKGTGDEAVPAFTPANSGTLGNPIVYVTKYAAVALGSTMAAIAASQNRTEIRHNGTADAADVPGTGGAAYGAYTVNHIVYDGIFVDMAEAHITADSGVISPRASTGVKFRNFVIKGTTTDVDSNPVLVRSNADTDTEYSNFWVAEFDNAPTGAGLNQEGIFSDLYGSQNYLIEHFLIENTDRGIFPKGTAASGTIFNYGTIQYGIIRNVQACFRFNDFDAAELTTVHHILCEGYRDYGLGLTAETSAPRNVLIHHVTIANGFTSNTNALGGLWLRGASVTNVEIRDSIMDYLNNGNGGFAVDADPATYATYPTMNYNGYYRGAGTVQWRDVGGTTQSTIADWRTASSQETNSQVLASDPFTNRGSDDYTIAGGHAALTGDTTGGELGAYEGTHTIGLDTVSTTSVGGTGTITFSGTVSIQ